MDQNFKYKYISTATTTTFGTQMTGVFHSIVIGETSAGSITISDAVGTIAVLKANIAEGTYIFNVAYSKNLVIVTAGASKITATYK